MSLLSVEGHADHTAAWIFVVPSESKPSCLACLLSILEDPALIPVQKKPALASLASLVQKSSEAVTSLQGNMAIASHCILTLMELLKLDDTVFVAQVLDVCVKVIGKIKSEDLVRLVLDIIQNEVTTNKDCRAVCPLFLLLGRMIHNVSSLAKVMAQDFDSLLQQLCSSLSFPDEDVRASIVYIFVYLLVGDWPANLSPGIHRQIVQEVLCLLSTAKVEALILNCLGLLRKLVTNGDSLELLMRLNMEGITLLAVLKKSLVSKKEVQQISSLQILSSIVKHPQSQSSNYTVAILQSDLMGVNELIKPGFYSTEFLFECLHTRNVVQTSHIFQCLQPLCQLEQFYTKCHSVYGIESLLRSLEILADMKNYQLSEDGLNILATVLTKQPSNVPLFINSKMVQFCLSIITRGLKQQHLLVFSASLSVLMTIIRKDHLLLPVPFEELEDVIGHCSKIFWDRCKGLEVVCPVKASKAGERKTRDRDRKKRCDIYNYCHIYLKCVRLLQACTNDPKASVSTFMAPTDNQRSSVEKFQEFLLRSSCDNCIPLVMDAVDRTEDPELFESLTELICHLYELDSNSMSSVIYGLCINGMLTRVLDIHTQHSASRPAQSMVDNCIFVMCQVLHDHDDKSLHPFPLWTSDTLKDIKYRLQDLPRIVFQVSLKKETKAVYLFLLYHAFKNDEMVLCGPDLQAVLDDMCGTDIGFEELSPLSKKHFIFLTAIAYCLNGDSQGVQQEEQIISSMSKYMCERPTEIWYTHHLAILRWTCQQCQLRTTAAHKVVEAWMVQLCGGLSCEDLEGSWLKDHPDVLSLSQLCKERHIIPVLLKLFLTSNEAVIQATQYLLVSYADQVDDLEERTDYLLYLSEHSADSLQQAFLDKTFQDAGLEMFLGLHLYCKQHIPDKSLSTSDIKILYHVIKSVASQTTIPVSLLLICVQFIQTSINQPDTASSHRVLSLVTQNDDMLDKLEKLCTDLNPHLSSVAVSIVMGIIVYTSDLPHHQCSRRMNIDLLPIDLYLGTDHPDLLQARLNLLCVLFRQNFSSSVITLANTQRYPPHPDCPFTSRDIREVYLHLQQLVLQECVQTKTSAIQCILAVLSYLHNVDPCLELHLRRHPWNSLMLEVVLQTYNTEEEDSLYSTISLIQQILCGQEISNTKQRSSSKQVTTGQQLSSQGSTSQQLSSQVTTGQQLSPQLVSLLLDFLRQQNQTKTHPTSDKA